jgi:spermidine/putrescine-binding protein
MPQDTNGRDRRDDQDAQFSRRALLGRAGAATVLLGGVPSLLAACGGASEGQGAAAAGPAGVPGASGTLNYFGWEGEDFKAATASFREAHKLALKSEAMASLDDGIAKLQGGSGGGIDLLGVSGVAIPRIGAADVLVPIDESKIPNLANLARSFQRNPPGPAQPSQVFDAKGRRLAVPTYFGTQGLTYDTEVLEDAPTSWQDVFKPALKGKIGFYNDPGVQFCSAAWVLGMNPAQVPKAKLPAVTDFINRLLDQVRNISASVGDLTTAMVSGDVAVAFTGYPAIEIFAAASGKTSLRTTFALEEGGWSYMELLGIPKSADNADSAYAYIDNLLDPSVNAAAAESVGGAVVVSGADEHLAAASRRLYPYADLDSFLKTAPLLPFAPLESDQYVTQAEWAEHWTSLTS